MSIVSADHVSGLIQRTLNYVDPRLVDHGQRVAYIISCMLRQEGRVSAKEYQDLCLLGMFHDIGAFKTEEIDQMVHFETENVWNHSVYGYLFIRDLSPLRHLAPAILFHHLDYEHYNRLPVTCGREAQLIYVADRLDILMQTTGLGPQEIKNRLRLCSGKQFDPAVVDLLMKADEQFHLMEHKPIPEMSSFMGPLQMTDEEIETYIRMLVFTIDFRSKHTVTQTVTTATIASCLASIMHLDEQSCWAVYQGAQLHDLGKVGIPVEILEFPGKLSPLAMSIMRTHVDLTEHILGGVVDETVTQIAIRHHEKLDGSGYPRGMTGADLTIPQRIVAVADIVSALSGSRSYKGSFSKKTTLEIVNMASDVGQLDPGIVRIINNHFDEIMRTVRDQAGPVLRIYEGISREYDALMKRYLTK